MPVELYIKIGDIIEIYVNNRVVKRIFCDEYNIPSFNDISDRNLTFL